MEDVTTGLPYYYNTATKVTTWVRPEDATIIPLTAVQVSSHSLIHLLDQRLTLVNRNRLLAAVSLDN